MWPHIHKVNVDASILAPFHTLQVPEQALEGSAAIRLHVTNYDGVVPSNFRLDGRIVSNRVWDARFNEIDVNLFRCITFAE
jgi:hypothetical protein